MVVVLASCQSAADKALDEKGKIVNQIRWKRAQIVDIDTRALKLRVLADSLTTVRVSANDFEQHADVDSLNSLARRKNDSIRVIKIELADLELELKRY